RGAKIRSDPVTSIQLVTQPSTGLLVVDGPQVVQERLLQARPVQRLLVHHAALSGALFCSSPPAFRSASGVASDGWTPPSASIRTVMRASVSVSWRPAAAHAASFAVGFGGSAGGLASRS